MCKYRLRPVPWDRSYPKESAGTITDRGGESIDGFSGATAVEEVPERLYFGAFSGDIRPVLKVHRRFNKIVQD